MTPNISLLNLLCRVCGQEIKNGVQIFGEEGKRQAIEKKLRNCLNLMVDESDQLPKQICITCLNKLETAWNLIQLNKEGQVLINKKLNVNGFQTHCQESVSTNDNQESTLCGACNREVHDHHLGVGCEGRCQKWYHRECINMTRLEYYEMANDDTKTWTCESCKPPLHVKEQDSYLNTIAETVKNLKENEKVLLNGKAVISLASPKVVADEIRHENQPAMSPVVAPVVVPTSEALMGVLQAPLVVSPSPSLPYMQPTSATTKQTPKGLAGAPTKENVYPKGLVQVSRKQPPVPMPRSMPPSKPLPSPRRNTPISAKRRAQKQENVGPSKRSNQICKYCNKSFPDDIIDHHVSLHLRQSFLTCIECNKNFRSEEAMSRHRCGASDSIDLLDSDEDEPIFV